MHQDLHFVTLATADLDAARRFYVAGLRWTPLLDVAEEIVFFQVAPGLALGFFLAEKFDADLGAGEGRATVSGLTLSHNVGNAEAVREVVAAMVSAGGRVLTEPRPGEFGGVFHAHVADPNGVVWEVAHNPDWSVGPDGRVRLA